MIGLRITGIILIIVSVSLAVFAVLPALWAVRSFDSITSSPDLGLTNGYVLRYIRDVLSSASLFLVVVATFFFLLRVGITLIFTHELGIAFALKSTRSSVKYLYYGLIPGLVMVVTGLILIIGNTTVSGTPSMVNGALILFALFITISLLNRSAQNAYLIITDGWPDFAWRVLNIFAR